MTPSSASPNHRMHLPEDLPDPAPTPHTETGTRGVLLPVVIGSIIGTIFVVVFVALFHAPAPHQLPVAVVGSNAEVAAVEQVLDAADQGGFDVNAFESAAEATQALEHRDVFGVYVPADNELLIAGANGPSVTGVLTGAFHAVSGSAGELTITDQVPTSAGDTVSLATFYAGFGVVLAGFLFGQITYAVAPLLPLRRRLLSIGIFAALNGILVSAIAGSLGFNALPGNLAGLALVIALLAAAIATATVTIIRVTGPAGTMISAVLLLILGNATGGGTLPIPFLPEWLQWVSHVLPVGTGITGIKGLSYFHGDGFAAAIYVPIIWVTVCIAILIVKDRQARRQ